VRDWFASQGCRDGCLQFASLRLRTFLPDREITVVNAATIDFAECLSIGIENGCFGGDSDTRKVDQVLLRIQHCWFIDGKGVIVLRDRRGIVLWVGKHPPNADTLLLELTIQSRDFGDVAVGDRTITGSKNEYDNSNARPAKLPDRDSLKVQSVWLSGM
jgi:hypothetical protein